MCDRAGILEGALQGDGGEEVGTYVIDLGTLSAGKNYTISFTGNDFSITPATLKVRAEAGQGKVYGGEDPELEYTVEGFVMGDDESILEGALQERKSDVEGTYAKHRGR